MNRLTSSFPVCLFAFCLSTICVCTLPSCDGTPKPKTEWELQQELKNIERSSPLNYLKGKDNFFFDPIQTWKDRGLFKSPKLVTKGYEISGVLINSAKLTTFYDAEIEFSFAAPTGTVMKTYPFVIHKEFPPGSETPVSVTIGKNEMVKGWSDFTYRLKMAQARY